MDDFYSDVKTAVEVFGEVMAKTQLGVLNKAVERISTFLDTRRSSLSLEECVNGSDALKLAAIQDIRRLGYLFVQNSLPTPAPVPAPTPAPVPAPRSVGAGLLGPRSYAPAGPLHHGATTRRQTGCIWGFKW